MRKQVAGAQGGAAVTEELGGRDLGSLSRPLFPAACPPPPWYWEARRPRGPYTRSHAHEPLRHTRMISQEFVSSCIVLFQSTDTSSVTTTGSSLTPVSNDGDLHPKCHTGRCGRSSASGADSEIRCWPAGVHLVFFL